MAFYTYGGGADGNGAPQETFEMPDWLKTLADQNGGFTDLGGQGLMGNKSWKIGDYMYTGGQRRQEAEFGGDNQNHFYGDSITKQLYAPYQAAGVNTSSLNGTPYEKYDLQGNKVGDATFSGVRNSNENLGNLVVALVGSALGGVALSGAGAGTAAGTGTSGAVGSGAGFVGEGAASGIPAWDGALTSATAGSAAGAGSGVLSQLGTTAGKKALGTILTQALGGGGGTNSGNGGGGMLGNLNLNDILGLIGGASSAYNQGQAADKMLSFINGNQAKMDNYMNPGSPEYESAWEAMSRKDAAAGRNSQYGPRTADFLGQVAQAKANNTRQFTTGVSRAYADALNQNAGRFAGLSAAGQRAATGSNMTLNDILGLFNSGGSGGGGSTPTYGDASSFVNQIYSNGGAPIDYGAGQADPTETDVWDFINRWGE